MCGVEYTYVDPGHTNLQKHSKNQHLVEYKDLENEMQIGVTVNMSKCKYSEEPLRIYAWIQSIILTLQPFSRVQCQCTRKSFRHDSISLNKFHENKENLTERVKKEKEWERNSRRTCVNV